MINFRNNFAGTEVLPLGKDIGWASIATQCPLLGGAAVYNSQNIINSLYPNQEFETDSLCVLAGFKTEESIDENRIENDISIYPNPNNGLFNILNNSGNIISIYDIYGRIIEVRMVQNDFETIDLHHLNKGIYLLHTTNIDSEKRVFKIVIE